MRSKTKLVEWQGLALFAAIALGGLVMAGCKSKGGDGAGGSATAGISAAAKQEAQQIFQQRCVPCHGAQGKGDGPASKTLNPKPRDFTDDQWQKSVTDEHIEKIVAYGGAAVGKSAAMPANPDLSGKEEVIDALRQHIRELGGK